MLDVGIVKFISSIPPGPTTCTSELPSAAKNFTAVSVSRWNSTTIQTALNRPIFRPVGCWREVGRRRAQCGATRSSAKCLCSGLEHSLCVPATLPPPPPPPPPSPGDELTTLVAAQSALDDPCLGRNGVEAGVNQEYPGFDIDFAYMVWRKMQLTNWKLPKWNNMKQIYCM